ncbi:MAG TPA: hypothetical protein V6D22_11545 [Candidatus Obscuribacterales bacterium]
MRQHHPNAQSFIEVAAGCVVMVPIALLVVDVVFVLNTSRVNSDLALSAARLAANRTDDTDARVAAQQAVSDCKPPYNVLSVELTKFNFDSLSKLVTVTTSMELMVPVPLPGFTKTAVTATSVQPIVGMPASR